MAVVMGDRAAKDVPYDGFAEACKAVANCRGPFCVFSDDAGLPTSLDAAS